MIRNRPFFPKENINLIGTVSDNGDISSWSLIGAFANPDTKQFFYATDGGCSCSESWELTKSGADLTPVTHQELVNKIRNWSKDRGISDMTVNELLDAIQKIR